MTSVGEMHESEGVRSQPKRRFLTPERKEKLRRFWRGFEEFADVVGPLLERAFIFLLKVAVGLLILGLAFTVLNHLWNDDRD